MKKRRSGTLLVVLIFLAGLGVLLYPVVSDYTNTYHQMETIQAYEKQVESQTSEKNQEILAEAQNYNEYLKQFQDIESTLKALKKDQDHTYDRILNTTEDGVMAVVDIPEIDVLLPVYHGTEDEELKKGAGHYVGSSLPVGGESTHCIITGHTGLPTADLFTRLDELEEGDAFYIRVLDQVLKYQVEDLQVVEPDEVDTLSLVEGKDLVTLITCTPYGVNSHRLLVTGKRVPYVEEEILQSAGKELEKIYIVAVCAGVLALIVTFFLGYSLGKSRTIKKLKKQGKERKK